MSKDNPKYWHSEIGFAIQSEIDLSERVDTPAEKPVYEIDNLVKTKDHEVRLTFGTSDNPMHDEHFGLLITVSANHIENPETKRAFHCHIDIEPTLDEITKLRDFLSFLIAHNDEVVK